MVQSLDISSEFEKDPPSGNPQTVKALGSGPCKLTSASTIHYECIHLTNYGPAGVLKS